MSRFTINTKLNTLAAALVARKPAHCFGYWSEQSTSNGLNIEQDPMQLASFTRGSGN